MIRKSLQATASALAILCIASSATAGVKYSYDSAGRLIRAEYSSGVTILYSYDAAGNRREITTTQIPNRSPVAVNDSAAVVVSGTADIQVRANDTDPDRNTLTITAVSAVTGGGTATIMGGGTHVRYVAPATTGAKSFTYTVSDGKGGTATATVSVTVNAAPNRAPVAVNDSATVVVSGTVDIQVRTNDSDPDGNPLAVTAVSAVTGGGTATIMGGGTHVRYVAPATTGAKTFTYTISDGQGGTATATVNVTVNPAPNRAPVAVNDSATVVASGTVDIQVRANDSDPDGDPLSVTAVSAVTGGGTATIMSGGAHVRYAAPATAGAKSFTYTISDGKGGTATATVAVTVSSAPNNAPIANHDEIAIEAGSDAAIMVLSNDYDPDNDPLTIVSTTTTICGTAQIAPGGSYIIYTAPSTKRGCGFSYTISDGRGGTASAPVQITVYAPGTQPPINNLTTDQPPDPTSPD